MNSGLKFALLFQIAVTAGAQGVWEWLADYPLEVFEVSATALDGKVYSVCGLTASGATNRMFVYDPRSDQCSEAAPAPLPNGGDHCNLATVGGRIYLLGALVRAQGGALADGGTYEYDAVTNTWIQVGRCPRREPRPESRRSARRSTSWAASAAIQTTRPMKCSTRRRSSVPSCQICPRPAITSQAKSCVAGFMLSAVAPVEARAPRPTTNSTRPPRMGRAVMQDRIILAGVGDGFRETLEYDALNDAWRILAPMIAPRNGWYGSSYSRTHGMFVYPPASPPIIREVRSAASLQPAIAPATLASLFGEGLAGSPRVGLAAAPSAQLNGVSCHHWRHQSTDALRECSTTESPVARQSRSRSSHNPSAARWCGVSNV